MIRQNPFHCLGLVADADVKRFTKRTGQVRAFLAADMPLQFEGDILFQGCLRNAKTIEVAERELQTASGKVKHGLFWFTSSGIVDEMALAKIREGDLDEAMKILAKAANRSDFSSNYISCLNNYSTLCLTLAVVNPSDVYSKPKRKSMLLDGLAGKFSIFTRASREVKKGFFQSIGDEIIAGQEGKIQEEFVASLQNILAESSAAGIKVTAGDLAKHVDTDSEIGKSLVQPFLNEARDAIDALLLDAEKQKGLSGQKALKAGENLLKKGPGLLKDYQAVAGDDDVLFGTLSDKIAEEILNAGIAYFNGLDDPGLSHIEKVLKLTEGARKIAVGTRVLERLDVNLETLRSRANREREHELIGDEIQKVNAAIEKAIDATRSASFSEYVLKETSGSAGSWGVVKSLRGLQKKGIAANGREFLTSDVYVELCTLGINVLLSKVINAVNQAQELGLSVDSLATRFIEAERAVAALKEISTKADGRTHESKFPIDAKTRNRILENHETIKSLKSQVQNYKNEQSNSGCMVIVCIVGFLILLSMC